MERFSIMVPQGTRDVCLRYSYREIYVIAGLSIIGTIATIILILYERFNSKKKKESDKTFK